MLPTPSVGNGKAPTNLSQEDWNNKMPARSNAPLSAEFYFYWLLFN